MLRTTDLMFPGIRIPQDGLPLFAAGEPWAVKVLGNPAPVTVGATAMSSSEALRVGLLGKALRITHYYHDLLCQGNRMKVVLDSLISHCVETDGFNNQNSDNEGAVGTCTGDTVSSENVPA
ncbi:hypothetical protein RND81_02G129400 [Saponaria officinalis]|uniref:Eukaryotic translation initiation factor 2D-like PUA RNA-binding domain-containing protein n=1 Tax=Saponaria officinalis TaxID=3572 RepID=A0AAW1MU24_SAPOF